MMKTPCNVIRDLLPLYHDGVCSPESRQLVEEHLEKCADCRGELERMDTPLPTAHPQVNERTVAAAASSAWRRGRRRAFSKGFVLAAVLAAVVFVLVGTWIWVNSWPMEVTGRIVETQVDQTTGEVTYVVYTTRGEEIGLLLEEDTWIRSYFDTYTEQDFRDGAINDALHIYAELGSNKETIYNQDGEKIPAYPAQLVEIDAYQMPDLMTLDDGTQVEVWQGHRGVLYALHDGPELLDVRTPTGPDGTYAWGVDTLGHLPQEAQDNILAYYQKQGLMYDTQVELERAYQEYLQWEFSSPIPTQILRQEITPTAANAEVIYFTTTIERCIDGGAVSIEPHCVPFSKETGEAMELQDVFLCTPETLIQTLLSHSNIATPELEPEMIDAFRLDYVTIGQERLGVTFPDGTLPSHEGTATFRFSYDDAVTWLMQPWAVPGAE